ncbi:DUF2474 family protein [Aureimonas mangrovi]|nr:DUF2474 family protein [Aureimonas mangrovi]
MATDRRRTASGPLWKRLAWFALLWCASLLAISIVAYAIRSAIL